MTYAEKQLNEQRNEEKAQPNEVSEIIQLYSYDYYDHPASAGTGQYLNDVRVEQIELPVDIDADFVIPIKGDSMEPDYHDGDLVFIQTSVDLMMESLECSTITAMLISNNLLLIKTRHTYTA